MPHGCLIAISGVSGSGKSSLAFDTIYAEARRRYLLSLDLSQAALVQRARAPRARVIEGLAPAIAIDQGRGGGHSARSTTATLTGLYDYLRLLFARLGEPRCLACGSAVQTHRFETVYEMAAGLQQGTKLLVLAPQRPDTEESGADLLSRVDRSGYRRLRIDGQIKLVEEIDPRILDDRVPGVGVEVVVDRLVVQDDSGSRLKGSLQAAVEIGQGQICLLPLTSEDSRGATGSQCSSPEMRFSVSPTCTQCSQPFRAVTPSLFSFNSSQGACSECRGLGTEQGLEFGRVFSYGAHSIAEALGPLWQEFGRRDLREKVMRLCSALDVDTDTAVGEWVDDDLVRHLWNGKGRRLGIRRLLEQVAAKASGDELAWLEDRLADTPCATCKGARLNPEALAVTLPEGESIASLASKSIDEALDFMSTLRFEESRRAVGDAISAEICEQLRRLVDLGLGYLTLNRCAHSLSSGEFQRLRFAAAIGSGMTQMLYVLDEPSVGLHARDTDKLARTLGQMRDAGNTVIVVEHDLDLLRQADHLVDMGPGAGANGGCIEAQGTPAEVGAGSSPTGKYLGGTRRLGSGRGRVPGERGWLRLEGARGHNLKSVNVAFPLENFICVTGVSGSGKSSLVLETVLPVLAARLHKAESRPLPHDSCEGIDRIERVVSVDQRQIGRSTRSNAATFTGLFGPIRRLFAELPEARMRGYRPAHFSFNAAQGACEDCGGTGLAADRGEGLLEGLVAACHTCGGRRYKREVLDVRYRELSVAQVLELSVAQASTVFEPIPDVARRLSLMQELGLGYLHLGQPASSLSGGEAQRIKLATELSRPQRSRTLYILDEPTTGLHLEDIDHLVELLQRFVDGGHSVIVVEHNIDLIAAADYIIDLGPEAGEAGGELVAAGTPADVARNEFSWTGRFLARRLAEAA